MSTITFDIEVAFYPEVTEAAERLGVDEKKFSWHIDAALRYVTHISYRIDKEKVVDLSLLDYKGNLKGDENEKELLKEFSIVYNQCHESVAHYGSKFDIRFLNSRIAKHNLPPLKPIKLRDTWRLLKDKFALPNNRLDTAIKFFGCPYGKPSLDWDVWRKVSTGDVKAMKQLRHRCHYDVLSLDWIYREKLRAYDGESVNKALAYKKMTIDDKAVTDDLRTRRCRSCSKPGLLKREGFSYAKTQTKMQLSCKGCGSWTTVALTTKGTIK